MDRATSDSLQQSAIGLAKAMQYGIDRIPAIVFDGQGLVYGVTDISAALAHYQALAVGEAIILKGMKVDSETGRAAIVSDPFLRNAGRPGPGELRQNWGSSRSC